MMKLAVLAALAGSAAAFAPVPTGKASTALSAEMSGSLPFLTKPSNLAGYVGDVGFDPLGFSDNFDMKWLREAELKHGRVAMLAAVGFVASEFVTFPMYEHVDESNAAPAVVGTSAMMQLLFAAGAEEWRTNKGNITAETMFSDPDREPGNIGFGLKYLPKDPKEADKLRLQELKNGRLAMLAIGGMIHHNFVTGEPLLPN